MVLLVSPAANEEYYELLMSSEKHACGADVPSYTVDEIESVTSEFIVKNVVSVSHAWRLSPEGTRPLSR